MCADLEARLRRALTQPTVPEGLHERLRAGARAAVARPRRARHMRRLGRGLVAVSGVAAAGVVAVVLALLVVAAPSDDAAGPAGGTAVEYLITPRSYDGVTPPASAEAVADVLRRRAAQAGLDGVGVRVEGGVAVMTVAGTHDTAWGTDLLQEIDLAIYDDRASVVAAATTTGPVVAAATAGSGDPTAWYAVGSATPSEGAPAHISGPYARADEAEAKAAEMRASVWPATSAVGVRGGVHLVLNWPGASEGAPDLAALRDPVVRPGAIAAVTLADGTLAIQVAPEAREAVGRRVNALGAEGRLVAVAGASALPGRRFIGYDPTTGILRFTAAPEDTAGGETRPAPGVDALLDIEVRRVGPAPERGGVPAEAPPEALQGLSGPQFRAMPGSTRRVLRERLADGTVTVWSRIGPRGDEVFGATFGPGGGGVVGECPRPPAAGRPTICGGGGFGGRHYSMFGRAGGDVAAVRAAYASGPPVAGATAHGFFVLALPVSRPAPVRIEGLAASGAVIGVADGPDAPDFQTSG